eukprot:Nk52_evm2s634 gene=Nk52_evmTU2s634
MGGRNNANDMVDSINKKQRFNMQRPLIPPMMSSRSQQGKSNHKPIISSPNVYGNSHGNYPGLVAGLSSSSSSSSLSSASYHIHAEEWQTLPPLLLIVCACLSTFLVVLCAGKKSSRVEGQGGSSNQRGEGFTNTVTSKVIQIDKDFEKDFIIEPFGLEFGDEIGMGQLGGKVHTGSFKGESVAIHTISAQATDIDKTSGLVSKVNLDDIYIRRYTLCCKNANDDFPTPSITNDPSPNFFESEAKLIGGLKNKSLVRLIGCCKSPICLVTEYAYDLDTLWTHIMAKKTNFSQQTKYKMCGEIISCVKYLHSQTPPVYFGDLRLRNIRVKAEQSPDGFALCDSLKIANPGFQWFKHVTNDFYSKSGSVWSIAPEVLDGSSKFTEKSDVYSFGVVCFYVFLAKDPYLPHIYDDVQSSLQMIAQSSTGQASSIQSLRQEKAGISRELANFIDKCVSSNPEERLSVDECINFFNVGSLDTSATPT